MARRNQIDGRLIGIVLLLAPVVWLHDKIGTTGIAIAVAAIIAVVFFFSQKKTTAKSTRRRTRSLTKATISIPQGNADDILKALDRMDMTDYLGQAAEAGNRAKVATANKDFDGAWRFYHEQKSLYLKHASRSEFTRAQTIALDGSVHRNLANLLRLENRHLEALVHFLYCYATSPRRTKTDEKQISAYVNRAKLTVGTNEVKDFVATLGTHPDFRTIQSTCARWKSET